jgi:hypothetical protein
MPIKSFRGLIADNTQQVINLHTNDGSVGYKIKKFEAMSGLNPTSTTIESVLAIYKIEQTSNEAIVDFSDQTLLGSIFYNDSSAASYPDGQTIIFDNEIFNQDIYITCRGDVSNNGPMNYYIEMEQVKLSLDENTVATLKDIRNITQANE